MALNSRGLGRGIQALFEGNIGVESPEPGTTFRMVALDSITPNPGQPRKIFPQGNLEELADSIKLYGILQPIVVREKAGGFEIIAGERRWRAARIAGLAEAPIIVRNLSDKDAMIITLLENLQREDLNPIEEARGLDALRQAMNTSLEEVAQALGQPRSSISNALRLLTLDSLIQKDIEDRKLSASHAKILAGLGDREAALRLHKRIIEHELTTRQTHTAVAFFNEHKRFPWEEATPNAREERPTQNQLIWLGEALDRNFNCRVKVSGDMQKGKITLSYSSQRELAQLLAQLGIQLQADSGEVAICDQSAGAAEADPTAIPENLSDAQEAETIQSISADGPGNASDASDHAEIASESALGSLPPDSGQPEHQALAMDASDKKYKDYVGPVRASNDGLLWKTKEGYVNRNGDLDCGNGMTIFHVGTGMAPSDFWKDNE